MEKYFEVDGGNPGLGFGCYLASPTKIGVKNLAGREGAFPVMLCADGEHAKFFRDQIAPRTGVMDCECAILSEEQAETGAEILEFPGRICPVFHVKAAGRMIPATGTPFCSQDIAFPQNEDGREILSFGNESEFSISFLKGKVLTLSANFGELESLYEMDGMDNLVHSIGGHIKGKPVTVVKDYSSYSVISDYVRKYPGVRNVSHVHSHLAAVMYENGFVREKGIGVIYDGVSTDESDQVLGGEILYGSLGRYETAGGWKPVPLPGGDIANLEPWRISLALVKEILKGDFQNMEIPLIRHLRDNDAHKTVFNAINQKNINYSLSTSMHHIVSALGELLAFEETVNDYDFFENKLDHFFVNRYIADAYPVKIAEAGKKLQIDTFDLFGRVLTDLIAGLDTQQLIYRSLASVAVATADAVGKISKKHNEKKVFLSGGMFKHPGFLSLIHDRLVEKGLEVYLPKMIPVDDSGVSAGQLIYAFFEKD